MDKLGFLEGHVLCLDVIDGKIDAQELVNKLKLTNWTKNKAPTNIVELANIQLSECGTKLWISTHNRVAHGN